MQTGLWVHFVVNCTINSCIYTGRRESNSPVALRMSSAENRRWPDILPSVVDWWATVKRTAVHPLPDALQLTVRPCIADDCLIVPRLSANRHCVLQYAGVCRRTLPHLLAETACDVSMIPLHTPRTHRTNNNFPYTRIAWPQSFPDLNPYDFLWIFIKDPDSSAGQQWVWRPFFYMWPFFFKHFNYCNTESHVLIHYHSHST
jgi:hypothetical protein